MKFYICKHCGQIITKLKDTSVPVICCGEIMNELIAGTTDASIEKHVPVFTKENNIVKVKIGSVEHPMTKEHFIQWVCLETQNGYQVKYLQPEQKPEVNFSINADDEIISVFAYCNLHSLWKA